MTAEQIELVENLAHNRGDYDASEVSPREAETLLDLLRERNELIGALVDLVGAIEEKRRHGSELKSGRAAIAQATKGTP